MRIAMEGSDVLAVARKQLIVMKARLVVVSEEARRLMAELARAVDHHFDGWAQLSNANGAAANLTRDVVMQEAYIERLCFNAEFNAEFDELLRSLPKTDFAVQCAE